MHTRVASPLDRLFFPLMGLTALAVVAAGFAPTYYLGFWFGAPPLETIVHVHAMAFTAWLVLLLSQTLLIRLRRARWHRAMGKVAVAVVAVMVVTGYMVIFGKPRPTPFTRAFIFTPMLSLLLFPLLFGAAIHFRRDPATHKRLMLLATILIANAGVQPADAHGRPRCVHYFQGYAVTYAAVAAAADRLRPHPAGTLHRATAWGMLVLLVRHPLHAAIAYTDAWQRFAAWLTPPSRSVQTTSAGAAPDAMLEPRAQDERSNSAGRRSLGRTSVLSAASRARLLPKTASAEPLSTWLW